MFHLYDGKGKVKASTWFWQILLHLHDCPHGICLFVQPQILVEQFPLQAQPRIEASFFFSVPFVCELFCLDLTDRTISLELLRFVEGIVAFKAVENLSTA